MSEPAMDFAALSAPNESHQKLHPFEGRFKAEVRMWMGPGDPHLTTGVMVNSLVLGGRYLQQEYQSDPNEGPFPSFEGRGFWGFNKQSQQYEGFWIDNASTVMQIEHGKVDEAGAEWVMEGVAKNPVTGDDMTRRSIIRLVDRDHHSMETYFKGPDGKEAKGMEIQYKRV